MDPREGHNFMVATKPIDWILDLRAILGGGDNVLKS